MRSIYNLSFQKPSRSGLCFLRLRLESRFGATKINCDLCTAKAKKALSNTRCYLLVSCSIWSARFVLQSIYTTYKVLPVPLLVVCIFSIFHGYCGSRLCPPQHVCVRE